MNVLKVCAAVMILTVVVGCATSRSVVSIDQPALQDVEADTGGTIYLESVLDNRIFEDEPAEPSTPSLGKEGASAASDEIRARAIGRKRNGYRKALGDVLLPEGETVERLIRSYAAAAFSDAGWRVVDRSDADLVASIQINEFWAWLNPGFWSIALNSVVSTTLEISGNEEDIPVEVRVEDSRQMATEAAWIEIVEMALQEYRRKVREAIPSSS